MTSLQWNVSHYGTSPEFHTLAVWIFPCLLAFPYHYIQHLEPSHYETEWVLWAGDLNMPEWRVIRVLPLLDYSGFLFLEMATAVLGTARVVSSVPNSSMNVMRAALVPSPAHLANTPPVHNSCIKMCQTHFQHKSRHDCQHKELISWNSFKQRTQNFWSLLDRLTCNPCLPSPSSPSSRSTSIFWGSSTCSSVNATDLLFWFSSLEDNFCLFQEGLLRVEFVTPSKECGLFKTPSLPDATVGGGEELEHRRDGTNGRSWDSSNTYMGDFDFTASLIWSKRPSARPHLAL